VPNPTTYASPRQFVGVAIEATQGTPLVPVQSIPVDKFDPDDKWTWLDDTALRGSMTEPYVRVQGVGQTEFDWSGPGYFDTLPYLLSNIFGDVVYSGTYTGSGTTTLSSASTVGATTISTALTIAATTVIQVDTGNLSEVRTVSSVSGSGPFVLTLSSALNNAHASAAVVKPVTAPFSQQFSVLNSGSAQPSSLSITDWQGPTATTQARVYPGACLSDLNLKGNAASSVVEYDAKGMGWLSVPASAAPTPIMTGSNAQAAWRSQIGLNGTFQGAPIKTILVWEIDIKRELEVIYTGQNSQNPYYIQRGKLTVTGKCNFVAADETPLSYMSNNTQPQLQIILTNGLTAAALLGLQIDVQKAAYTTSKIDRTKPAVQYAVEFAGIANTTNAGASGGYSPISITTQNAISTTF
jgi:hypothetical protein